MSSLSPPSAVPRACWADWHPSAPYTVGIEEEVMLLAPGSWELAHAAEDVLERLPPVLCARAGAETHAAALELHTAVHDTVSAASEELSALRAALRATVRRCGLEVAASGTHPHADWRQSEVSSGARYQLLHESMRELARREPTFALHVHIGVPDPDSAVRLLDRLRIHLPLLLALAANSPFWQGRDAGLCSSRTPIFQAFPRAGLPRSFGTYESYVKVVDLLIRCGAFPEPTFLWWDVRLQPRLGTVEVRIMDVQSSTWRTACLAALVQSLARLELEEGDGGEASRTPRELLEENRFLAARDGMAAALLDPMAGRAVPARRQLDRLLAACRPHAQDLGAAGLLAGVTELAADSGAARQRRLAANGDLRGLIGCLAGEFAVNQTR